MILYVVLAATLKRLGRQVSQPTGSPFLHFPIMLNAEQGSYYGTSSFTFLIDPVSTASISSLSNNQTLFAVRPS